MPANCSIHYIEFGATNLDEIQSFYTSVFGWSFQEWSDSYIEFHGAGVEGGFTTDSKPGEGALVIMYHDDLEMMQEKVAEHGGKITKEIFSFPGGKRFEFLDPSGNNLSVWCKE